MSGGGGRDVVKTKPEIRNSKKSTIQIFFAMLYLQDFSLLFNSLPNLLCPAIAWQKVLEVIALMVCWGVIGYVTAGKHDDLCIKFGLIGVDEFGEYYVQQETTHVPLYPIEYYPEFRRILKSIPILFQGGAVEALAFNESDPLGKWKVDIYVNDELVRKIGFRVVPP